MPTSELIATAINDRAWYPLAGVFVTLILVAWKRFGPTLLVGRLPTTWQWVPAVAVTALGAFVDAQAHGEPWQTALGLMAYAGVSAGMVAVGAHHTAKRLIGGQ